jgi:sister-chromatid-cohesion protein PDS5
VRKELISTTVFLHKDKGVKAYAACCIADLLSIYAPDAPYTAAELRVRSHSTCAHTFVHSPLVPPGAQDIFQFFFRQLVNGLKGPDAPYYDQYVHLLRSLSRAKSVVLVCDLPHADELLIEVFKDFFTLSKLNLPATVEAFMADILTALIDEAQSVPNEVLEILLSQFNAKKIVGFLSRSLCVR